MKFFDSKVSFAAGELSPALAARADLAAYNIGASEITNCLVLPQGGLINRPGTRKLAAGEAAEGGLKGASLPGAAEGGLKGASLPGEAGLKGASLPGFRGEAGVNDRAGEGRAYRLVPFVNGVDSFCLVFKYDHTVDVFNTTRKVCSISGSPYGAGQFRELRWLQSVDVIYLFHQRLPVHKLLHLSDTNWRFEKVEFRNGPYRDFNTDGTKKMRLWFNSYDKPKPFARLEIIGDYFSRDMVGMFAKLEQKVKAASGDELIGYVTPTGGGSLALVEKEFMLFGPSTIETHGNWKDRTIEVYRKESGEDNYPTVPFRVWPGDGTNNFGLSVNEEMYGVMYKVRQTDATDGNVRVTWTSGGGLIDKNLKIEEYKEAAIVYVTILDVAGGGEGVIVNWTSSWAIGAFGEPFGYPAVGVFHQERLVLANTPADPQTLWMSQPASWENFDSSIPALDTDSITVTLAARTINRIHGFSTREDLIIFTSEAEWVGHAGSKSDVFTPSSVVFSASGYRGSEPIDPLEVGQSILFVQRGGKIVRGMGYQLDIDGYASSELSILSNHLTEGTRIVAWAYQQDPWSIAWVALADGTVLALTIQQEHQVTAWTRHRFNGRVKDLCVISGQEQDELFMLIDERLVILEHREDREGMFTRETYLDDGRDAYVSAFESMELEQNIGNGTIQGRYKHASGATLRLFRTGSLMAGIMTENSRILDRVHDSEKLFTGDKNVPLPGGIGRQCRIRVENDKPCPMTLLGIFREVTVHEGR